MINLSPYKEQITCKPQFVLDGVIPGYFSAADFVVLPYFRTAVRGVANIAPAYGKPIITSDLETMQECLKDYEGAMFTPVGDSAAIAQKLTEIDTQYKSGKAMVYNPPQNTWDEIAREYEQIIEQII